MLANRALKADDISPDEYLSGELVASEKHEYLNEGVEKRESDRPIQTGQLFF